MIVVSDTTPIISLLKADYLELLEKLYGKVIIPKAVYQELIENPAYEREAEIIKNTEFLKKGNYLLEDRGFLDIAMIRHLHNKGVFVIVPSKKNMEIYQAAVASSKTKNEWSKHPNSKRMGQDLCLIEKVLS